jgi:hypothetical protein
MYLEDAPEFKEIVQPDIQLLYSFNIRHVEQLVALLSSRFGVDAIGSLGLSSGLSTLEEAINSWVNFRGRENRALAAGLRLGSLTSEPEKFPLYSYGYALTVDERLIKSEELNYGYTIPEGLASGILQESSFSSASESATTSPESTTFGLPNQSVILVDGFGDLNQLPDPLDQGARGTCTAFTGCHVFEAYILTKASPNLSNMFSHARVELSQQYLYYRIKQNDPANEGSTLVAAMDALRDFGTPPAANMKYVPFQDWGQKQYFERNKYDRDSLDKVARQYRVKTYQPLKDPSNVDLVKEYISKGHAIGVSIPIFEQAWYNPYSRQKGEVQIPLFKRQGSNVKILDNFLGGHAITLYAYVDNGAPRGSGVDRAGGGYFIFRNSWGPLWAPSDEAAPRGYGLLPYRYLKLFSQEAVVITGGTIGVSGREEAF